MFHALSRRGPKAVFFSIVAITMLFATSACSFPFKSKVSEAGVIRIQIGGEPGSLDPARTVDQYSIGILRNVVEGLFKLDSQGKLRNGLVSEYRVSDDGLTYRFKVRADAKWSDGEPVTVDDFVFGLKRLLAPETASQDAEHFFAIQGARDYYMGRRPHSVLGITRDNDELVIKLERPDPTLPFVLSLPAASPLRKDAFEAAGSKWTHQLPVTGPYLISVYKPASEIRLDPNPHYPGPTRLPILYRILQEEITAMNLFEAGRLDIISTVTPTEADRLKQKGLVKTAPSTTVFYLSFNVSRPPFNDVAWRRAIAASIDRHGLGVILKGLYEPTPTYIPKTLEGYEDLQPLSAQKEIEKIRALEKKPKIRLAYGTSAASKIIVEKIQSDLKSSLGINLELEPMELKTLLHRLQSDPPEIYYLGKSALFDDAIAHLDIFNSSSGPNFSRYKSEEFQDLLMKIRTTPLGAERNALVRQANRLLVERDTVIVPLALRLQIFGVSKSLKNFQVSPYQVIDLAGLAR